MFYVFPYLAQFLLRLGVKYIIGRVCFAHDEWRNFAATALVFYYYFAEDRVEYNFCNGGGVGGWVPFWYSAALAFFTHDLAEIIFTRDAEREESAFFIKTLSERLAGMLSAAPLRTPLKRVA